MFRLNPLLGFWAGTTIVNQFSPVASTSLATSLWKTPPNVTKLQIEAWGAGGQSGLSTNGEGGGGGGAYAVHSDFDTVADEVFRFTIGDGGGNFQDGGESYVDRDLTTLLLHCEGVDGATTTEDDSGFKQSVTFQGNAEIDTAQFKFGTSSILFGGVSTDYIEIAIEPELEPISDQFTCEAWVRFASVDNTAIFFSQNQTDDVAWSLDIIVGDLLRLRYTDPVTGLDANIVILDTPGGTWNPTTGVWYHVAVDRDSTGTVRVYVDGAVIASGSAPDFWDSSLPLRMGEELDGWMDEIRFTWGRALYAGAFTPNTGPSQIAPPGGLTLLTELEGADGATTAVDDSSRAHTLTFTNNAELDTAQFKHGTSSLLLDASDDSGIEIANHPDFHFGRGAFTVELFARFDNVLGNKTLLGQWDSSGAADNSSWIMDWEDGTHNLRWLYTTDGISVSAVTLEIAWLPTINTWYHIAAVRDLAGEFRFYVDGLEIYAVANDAHYYESEADIWIGKGQFSGVDTNTFHGWLDGIRVHKGEALYTEDFTPPAAPYTIDRPFLLATGGKQGLGSTGGAGGLAADCISEGLAQDGGSGADGTTFLGGGGGGSGERGESGKDGVGTVGGAGEGRGGNAGDPPEAGHQAGGGAGGGHSGHNGQGGADGQITVTYREDPPPDTSDSFWDDVILFWGPALNHVQDGKTYFQERSKNRNYSRIMSNVSVLAAAGPYGEDVYDFALPTSRGIEHGLHDLDGASNQDWLNNDFTIECFVKFDAFSGGSHSRLIHMFSGGTQIFQLYGHATNKGFSFTYEDPTDDGVHHSQGSMPLNVWHHVAATRSGNTIRLWVNGEEEGTADTSVGTIRDPNTFNEGIHFGQDLNGKLANVRITRAVRYTASFTPGEMLEGTLSGGVGAELDEHFEKVVLLCNMDTPMSGGDPFDYSLWGRFVEKDSNAALVTAGSPKYGARHADLKFDGLNSTRFEIADADSTGTFRIGTQDFTMELWAKFDDAGAETRFMIMNYTGNNGTSVFTFDHSSTAHLRFAFSPTGNWADNTIYSFAHALTAGVYYHFAISRNGDDLHFYADGVLLGTADCTGMDIYESSTVDVTIGARAGTTNNGAQLDGYADDVRVTVGVGRYPVAFTPTGPHPLSRYANQRGA